MTPQQTRARLRALQELYAEAAVVHEANSVRIKCSKDHCARIEEEIACLQTQRIRQRKKHVEDQGSNNGSSEGTTSTGD